MGVLRPLEIYVHIPFCRQKCLYCDFLSAAAPDGVMGRYVDALCRQVEREALQYAGYVVQTVFVGGGTPSILTGLQMQRILGTLREYFTFSPEAEITVECNPGTLDDAKLACYRQAGVNRLSIGLQSAQDSELRALGRIHDFAAFLKSYRAARKAGFSNINVDLLSALPGQTLEGWTDTLRKTAALLPEHISAYSLIIEEGTPFYDRYGDGCAPGFLPLPSEEEERRMYERTGEFLREQGYYRYEISNYAKQGYACRHNIGYWKRTEYVGFGLGASSLVDNVRWKTTQDLENYENTFERTEIQRLSRTEQMEEFMFLGLRMTEGVAVADFRRLFGIGIWEVYRDTLCRLEKDGLLLFFEDGKRIRLTQRGVDVSNYVLGEFLL